MMSSTPNSVGANRLGVNLGAYVVTGAGSGIGLATAQLLAEQGHSVFGIGRDATKLERVQKDFGAGRFAFASADLGCASGCAEAVEKIHAWLKVQKHDLLGLVNNAGVFDRVSFIETSDEIWERQFNNNLLSAVRLTRSLYELLKRSGSGAVVNVSSTLGIRPVADTSAYSALKAAMVNWTHCLALEWAKDRIRVNCVAPGLVDTPIHGFYGQPDTLAMRQQAHSMQPLGRMGAPREIAEAVVFLLGEKSSWTTGAITRVDGGISL